MFKKILLITTTFIIAIINSHQSFANQKNINPKTVIWNSEIGIARLNDSAYKNDFYQLANFYQAQINPIYCSSASALIIKNALFYNEIPSQKSAEIIKPNGESIRYNLYSSQEEFFNNETDKIKARDVIKYRKPRIINLPNGSINEDFDPGLNLSDFAKILKTHKIRNKIYYQEDTKETSIEEFRIILKKILNDKTHFIIANFNGKVFGNQTGGHFSPIVAYDEASDSVLVLDVALYKNPWYWVEVADLVKAMNNPDGDQPRGYLVVWR